MSPSWIAAGPPTRHAFRTQVAVADRGRTAFHVLLLLTGWIQFSGAWIYPSFDFNQGLNGIVTGKPMGSLFQYAVWFLVAAALVWRRIMCRRHLLLRTLAPFVPFGITGFVAAMFGHDPVQSLRWVALWTVAVLAGSVVGQALDARVLVRWLALAMLATMIASLSLAFLAPGLGVERDGLGIGMRGTFTGKNQLGWISAICVMTVVVVRHELPRVLMLAVAVTALSALWLSQSKGALVAATVSFLLLAFLRHMRHRATQPLTLVMLLVVLAVAAMMAPFVVQGTLDFLGKDTTLSGRTIIWSVYSDTIGRSPWIGEGPGAFTGPSPFTLPLAARLLKFGAILTPHNLYLATIGDAGLPGLLALVSLLGWLAFVLPLRSMAPMAELCAAVALLTMLHGTVETHDVFAPGVSWFLIAMTWAASRLPRPDSGRWTMVPRHG